MMKKRADDIHQDQVKVQGKAASPIARKVSKMMSTIRKPGESSGRDH